MPNSSADVVKLEIALLVYSTTVPLILRPRLGLTFLAANKKYTMTEDRKRKNKTSASNLNRVMTLEQAH